MERVDLRGICFRRVCLCGVKMCDLRGILLCGVGLRGRLRCGIGCRLCRGVGGRHCGLRLLGRVGLELAGAVVAAVGAFHRHRRNGQKAPAAHERIDRRVCRLDGAGLHAECTLFGISGLGNQFEARERGAAFLDSLVVSVFEGDGACAYRLVAAREDVADELALAHLDAHVLGFRAVDDEGAVAGRFDLVAVACPSGGAARHAEFVTHRVGE